LCASIDRDELTSEWMHAVDTFAVVCKETRRVLTSLPTYAFVVYFVREHSNLKVPPECHRFFLEGLPSGSLLFTWEGTEVEEHLYVNNIRTCADVHQLRSKLIHRTVSFPSRVVAVATLPSRVSVFVAGVRFINDTLAHNNPFFHVRQCENARCERAFLVETDNATSRTHPMIPLERVSDYWQKLGGNTSFPSYEHPTRRFCCKSCFDEWKRHFDAALSAFLPHSLQGKGKEGVTCALAQVVGRNCRCKQLLKAHVLSNTSPVHASTVSIEKHALVTVLNRDLMLLYAAATLARAKTIVQGRALPGSTHDWRDTANATFTDAINEVVAIESSDRIIAHVSPPSRHLHRFFGRAHRLFL
jgi:hypothetical protein